MGHITHFMEMRNACKILVRKLQEKSVCLKSRHKWNKNTEIDLRVVGCEVIDWTEWAKLWSSCRPL